MPTPVITHKSMVAVRKMLKDKGYLTYSMIQNRLKLGYFRATAILERLHADGLIEDLKGPFYRAVGQKERDSS